MKEQNYCVTNYQNVLLLSLCSNPKDECFFGKCQSCRENNILINVMKEVFQSHGISEVSYKHWVSQPRATLETLKIPF